MSAAPRLSVVGSDPLIPPELEKFANLLAVGKTGAQAYQESQAGAALSCGLPLLMTADVQARVAYLRSQAEPDRRMSQPALRELARGYTAAAVRTLAEVMSDPLQPASARANAARDLLEFGHGKAPQKYEVEVSVFDSLSPEQRQQLDAALDLLLQERAMVDVTPR